MDIKELQQKIMQQAKDKGFGIDPSHVNIAEKFALIHSEVSEAYEAYRKKNNDYLFEELGDIVARVFHLAGIFNVDLEKELLTKLEKNKDKTWLQDSYQERFYPKPL